MSVYKSIAEQMFEVLNKHNIKSAGELDDKLTMLDNAELDKALECLEKLWKECNGKVLYKIEYYNTIKQALTQKSQDSEALKELASNHIELVKCKYGWYFRTKSSEGKSWTSFTFVDFWKQWFEVKEEELTKKKLKKDKKSKEEQAFKIIKEKKVSMWELIECIKASYNDEIALNCYNNHAKYWLTYDELTEQEFNLLKEGL